MNNKIALSDILRLELVAKLHYLLISRFKNTGNIFDAFDRNEDGFIDFPELRKGFLAFFNYKTEENLAIFMDYYDRDLDGKISVQDWEDSSDFILEDIRLAKRGFFSNPGNAFEGLEDRKEVQSPKNDVLRNVQLNNREVSFLMDHNDSFNAYLKKTSLLRSDPFFMDPASFEDGLQRTSRDQGSSQRRAFGLSSGRFAKETQEKGGLDDSTGSELSFEKVCEEVKQENPGLSSEKRIKAQFSANESFYQSMLNELRGVKVSEFEDAGRELHRENPGESERNTEVLTKANNSFLENPIAKRPSVFARVLAKNPKKSEEKVQEKFDSLDSLTELKRRLREKEMEIGRAFQAPVGRKLEGQKVKSPVKGRINEDLVRSATEKVQRMFEDLKKHSTVREGPSINQSNSEDLHKDLLILQKFSSGKINSLYDNSKPGTSESVVSSLSVAQKRSFLPQKTDKPAGLRRKLL